MLKKYVVATAAAVACSGMALAAQAPGSTAGTSTGTTTQAPSAQTAAAKPSATFTGCIYKEKDVPSRSPNVAERVGIGEDYILAEVRPAAGTSGAVGTSGSTAADANRMYKLEFVDDGKLSAMAGKRVEVTGRVDAEAGDAKGQSGPTASQTDRVIGRDRVDLAEFEVTSIREVEGTCPATPSVK